MAYSPVLPANQKTYGVVSLPKRIISEDDSFFYVVQQKLLRLKKLNEWHWDFWTPLFSVVRRITPSEIIAISFRTKKNKREPYKFIIKYRAAVRKTEEVMRLRELYPGKYLYIRDPKKYTDLQKYLPKDRKKYFTNEPGSYHPSKVAPIESLHDVVREVEEIRAEEETELTNVIPPARKVDDEENMLDSALSENEDV